MNVPTVLFPLFLLLHGLFSSHQSRIHLTKWHPKKSLRNNKKLNQSNWSWVDFILAKKDTDLQQFLNPWGTWHGLVICVTTTFWTSFLTARYLASLYHEVVTWGRCLIIRKQHLPCFQQQIPSCNIWEHRVTKLISWDDCCIFTDPWMIDSYGKK